jgi:TonB family protein
MCVAIASCLAFQTLAQNVARVHEAVLRKAATTVVMPLYPSSSRKRGTQGLAVVELTIDEQGKVLNVKVVESPDEDIGNAVTTAVRGWKFAPLSADGKPIQLNGKLSFYFTIKNGKGRVSNPRTFEGSKGTQR